MSREAPSIVADRRGPGPLPIALSVAALLAFCAYLWTILVPPSVDLVIAFPRKSVLFAGHVGLVLQRTDILAQNGVHARFETSESLNEFGELAETADVVLTGEAHGLRLASRPEGARIVATLGSGGRLGLVVPPDSDVESIAGLKGKRIAATPGNALHRWLLEQTRGAGLADDDWTLVPFDGPENAATTDADSAAQWDPYLFMAEQQGRASTLALGDYFITVVFSEHLLEQDRELGLATLTAVKQAFHYFNSDPRLVAQWMEGQSGKPPVNLQRMCFGINASFRTAFSLLMLTPAQPSLLRSLEADNAFLVEQGFIDAPLNLAEVVDSTLIDQVDARAVPLTQVG